jgi:hypothetical protein
MYKNIHAFVLLNQNNDCPVNLEKNFGSRQQNLNLYSWFYNKGNVQIGSAWEQYYR